MYIPFNEDKELIYCFDVNGLYPYVMMNKDMPIGLPVFFKGNILVENPKPFGFFYVKVKAPNNLLHPIIHYNDGIRTLSPLGTFEMMIE